MAENTTAPVTMEIINSEQFKRANIRFNGKPAEEIREELNLINTVLSKRYFVLVQHRRWKCIQLMDESLSLSSIYMFMFL